MPGAAIPRAWACPNRISRSFPVSAAATKTTSRDSGIATSRDRIHWEIAGWVNSKEIDDRNVILFPEKINGKFAVLRRPSAFVTTQAQHADEHPAVRLSYSDDLVHWSEPQVVIRPQFAWENNRIGGSTPPIKTAAGLADLLSRRGDHLPADPPGRLSHERHAAGPARPDRRSWPVVPNRSWQPETYYENFGVYIPHVVFPTGAVVKDGLVYIYYGVCDTAIALATVPLDDLLAHVLQYRCRTSLGNSPRSCRTVFYGGDASRRRSPAATIRCVAVPRITTNRRQAAVQSAP